jgi:GT2 family glycosyltransferase
MCRTEVAWVQGACLAARRNVFQALGGFDPKFFLYFEETDLCLRARRAGYRIEWLPHLQVLHAAGHSQAPLSQYQRHYNLFAGLTVFLEKYFAPRDTRSMLRFQWAAASLLLAMPGPWLRYPAFLPERLRARRDICRQYLRNSQCSLFPVDLRTWRMAARVLRLSFDWLRSGGKLAVDDL